MKNIAIIPARSGSKRIPKKNIRNFLGKPIISYSIEAALKTDFFDEVMVSTEDSEIAEIAKKLGAKVPFMRSKKNADDYATTADVLLEVLFEYEKHGKEFDYLCCIYPTAPFVNSEKLILAYKKLIYYKADSVVPISKYSYPVQRSFRILSENKIEYLYPENENKRSQDFELIYHDVGQFYWIKCEKFVQSKKIVTKNTIPFILPEIETQDIDNLEDWVIAELKYKLNK